MALADPAARPRATVPHLSGRGVLTLILVAAFAVSCLGVEGAEGVSGAGGTAALGELVQSIAQPDLSPGFVGRVVLATLVTVAYAVAGISVGLLVGLPSALAASGVLVQRRRLRLLSVTVSRGVLAVLRAMHELVWALLFVAAFGLSPWAGVLAIGVPYGATIGRVVAERIQDVPGEPLEALRTAGASEWQVLVLGRLPAAGADLVGYLFYRFECAIRAAAILSFVGLGGLGFLVEIALDDLRFERVWPPLLALVLVIVAVDAVSARLRTRMVGR